MVTIVSLWLLLLPMRWRLAGPVGSGAREAPRAPFHRRADGTPAVLETS
jgi:hypothetical protein